jgi:hypothetical protein
MLLRLKRSAEKESKKMIRHLQYQEIHTKFTKPYIKLITHEKKDFNYHSNIIMFFGFDS